MRYIELDTDDDRDAFRSEIRRRERGRSRSKAYWNACQSKAYQHAGRPLPPGNDLEWNPREGWVTTRPILTCEIRDLRDGGALVKVHDDSLVGDMPLRSREELRPRFQEASKEGGT